MNYVEKLIVSKVAAALIAAKGNIVIDGERGYDSEAVITNIAAKAVAEAGQFDEAHIFVEPNFDEGHGAYVYLIFGNGNGGWDVISDYSMSLEPILKPIFDWIEKEGDQ